MATVLIGENVPDIQRLLVYLFERAGYAVRSTASGADILAHVRHSPPDLLLMNPTLPGVDGLEVCRRIRADPHTRGLPIIMVSTRQYPAEVDAARAAGADDYIGKPFEPDNVIARANALTGHAPADHRSQVL